MQAAISRRLALRRGVSGLGGLLLGLGWLGRAQAQEPDLPDIPPAPSNPPPSSASSDGAPRATPAEDDIPRPNGIAAPTDAPPADTDGAAEEAPEEPVATGPWGVPPVELAMPSLGVEAPVVPVGQDEDGAMAAPSDPDTVAWYEYGPGMGVSGNVVLAGHINWAGRVRAFGYLDRLVKGDPILVTDADGHGYQYVVESTRWVRAEGAPVEEIFAGTGEPVLTLITCGGEYVAATREYLDRLIVRAKGA